MGLYQDITGSLTKFADQAKDAFTKGTGVNPSTVKPEGDVREGAGRTITGGKRYRSQKRTHKHRRHHKKFKKTHKRR